MKGKNNKNKKRARIWVNVCRSSNIMDVTDNNLNYSNEGEDKRLERSGDLEVGYLELVMLHYMPIRLRVSLSTLQSTWG